MIEDVISADRGGLHQFAAVRGVEETSVAGGKTTLRKERAWKIYEQQLERNTIDRYIALKHIVGI